MRLAVIKINTGKMETKPRMPTQHHPPQCSVYSGCLITDGWMKTTREFSTNNPTTRKYSNWQECLKQVGWILKCNCFIAPHVLLPHRDSANPRGGGRESNGIRHTPCHAVAPGPQPRSDAKEPSHISLQTQHPSSWAV